jgi:pimeloyl-ACP methyl ester carboxylesterase
MPRTLVLLATFCCWACGGVSSPTAASGAASSSTGFFQNGDVRLSYQLDVPQRTGAVGAVVIGHGSGMTTKEQCRFLASGFLQRGFATLCYDKRGVGQSTGEYSGVGPVNSFRMFDLLGGDMAAGAAFLRTRPEIDPARIGLAGNSQAGWIIPVAAERAHPAFMIMLVGPTVSVGIENFYSNIVEFSDTPIERGYEALPSFTGNHGFDPKPVLEKLNVPGLWLLGGEDRSIPTPATVAILDELIAAGRPYERVVFAGSGHDLRGANYWVEIDRWLGTILH